MAEIILIKSKLVNKINLVNIKIILNQMVIKNSVNLFIFNNPFFSVIFAFIYNYEIFAPRRFGTDY